MAKIASNVGAGAIIGFLKGVPIFLEEIFHALFTDIVEALNTKLLGKAIIFEPYLVATVPTASLFTNGTIIVTDETGGRTLATSDGTNWLRVADGAIIS